MAQKKTISETDKLTETCKQPKERKMLEDILKCFPENLITDEDKVWINIKPVEKEIL